MEWKLTITREDNGYSIKTKAGTPEEGYERENKVIQDCDCEHSEHKTMQRLLQEVQNYYGIHPSKHNKINCRVRLEDENGKVLD